MAMMRHQFFGEEVRVPPKPIPVVNRLAGDYATPPASGLRATWIGHASVKSMVEGFSPTPFGATAAHR